jgi:hypothetical protein
VQHGVWIHLIQLQQVLDVDESVFPSRFGGCSACSQLTTCSANNLEKQNLTGVGGLIIVWHLLPTCTLRTDFCVHEFFLLLFSAALQLRVHLGTVSFSGFFNVMEVGFFLADCLLLQGL